MSEQVLGNELWQWRIRAQIAAEKVGIKGEELDWLLKEISDLDGLSLRLESFKDWPVVNLSLPFAELVGLWERRLQEQVPVQYLLGYTYWRNFRLSVSPAVLIPRPETEEIIDIALAAIDDDSLRSGSWVDLGTGTGAIALGLAEQLTKATIYAIDYSSSALAIAQQNSQNLGFGERIHFYQGSWFEPLEHLQGKLVGMISNPPYIPNGMIPTLQPEVANHEPALALAGGEDGLDCIRYLVATAPQYLQAGGIWLVEMMAGQGEAVRALLSEQGCYRDITTIKDLAGIERFTLAYIC